MKAIFVIGLISLTCALATPGFRIRNAFQQETWPIFLNTNCQQTRSAVECSFDFINTANEDYYLLKRNTPLEGILSPFIAVSCEGHPLQYKGKLIYRMSPTKDEFVLLKAGESISASVDITSVFTFDSDGLYTIQYTKPLQYLSKEAMQLQSTDVKEEVNTVAVSSLASVFLTNVDSLSKPVIREEQKKKSNDVVSISSCTSASFIGGGTAKNRNDISDAHDFLCKYLDLAEDEVGDNSLYRTWFGTYNTDRSTKVTNVLKATRNGLINNDVTYSINPSDCEPTYLAFTYFDSKTTYICPGFHNLGVYCTQAVTDNKEGVLTHEWTHAFGYVRDHAYSEEDTKNLAKNYPSKAINNAGNYEFYYCSVGW